MQGSREDFWQRTPRELRFGLDAAARRLERAHNERAWIVWHIAALGRAKKLPRLETMLAGKHAAATRRQTWQEQLAIMDAWSARIAKRNLLTKQKTDSHG